MKDKGFKIIFVIYMLALVLDLVSTLRMGELLKYLEANPVYKYGGLPLITGLNILFMAAFYYMYNKGTINGRFLVIFSMVAIITTRLIAIRQNFLISQNPPTLEQAVAITQSKKTETIVRLVVLNILPFFNGIITWIFFKLDHNIKRIGDKH